MGIWAMALASVGLASAGQLLLKYGLNRLGAGDSSPASFLIKAAQNPYVILGLMAYGLSMLLWMLSLRRAPLGLLYPLVSLSYVAVAAGSVLFFREAMPPVRLAGLAVIIAGVMLVVRS